MLEPAGIYVLYPHNRHLSAKVRAFVDFLVERFGREPAWDCAARGDAPDAARSREGGARGWPLRRRGRSPVGGAGPHDGPRRRHAQPRRTRDR